jgi:hypothetical protein
MSKQKFSLYVLSIAFLCSDNFSGLLFADSSVDYYLEDEEDYYEEERDRPLSQNAQKQKPAMNSNQMDSDQMNDEEMMMAGCCPPIVEDCCYCNICPPTEMITPLGGPCVIGGRGAYATADFIFWTAQERETAVAATTGFASFFQTGVPSTQTGKVIRFDQKYKPGFKVGLGLDFCHDGWDLYAQYTWYRLNKNTSDSVHLLPNTQDVNLAGLGLEGFVLWDAYWGVNGSNTVIGENITFTEFMGTLGLRPQTPVFGNVQGKWHLRFDVIDLELGRNFYISRRLMMRPYIGVKGSWQKQTLDINFTNSITNLNTDLTFIPGPNVLMAQTLKDWGVGPRMGLNTSWHFSRLFSLTGNLAFTGLFEHFSTKRFDYAINPPNTLFPGLSNSQVHLESSFFAVEPIIEWMLGLRFESWFSCGRYHAALEAGWEEQIWFGQNQFLRNRALESSEGNLTLAGLTVHARFDF